MLKQLAVAFLLAAAGYAVLYKSIEHWRTRNGPWQVTFTNSVGGNPLIVVDQPKLGISDVQLEFVSGGTITNTAGRVIFKDLKGTPYALPFGQCVFMDLTSLPGTVVMNISGHEVELLPRVLVLDKKERAWVSGSVLRLEK